MDTKQAIRNLNEIESRFAWYVDLIGFDSFLPDSEAIAATKGANA